MRIEIGAGKTKAGAESTRDDEKVRLGESGAPSFGSARTVPEKVRDEGKVRLGDPGAPNFGPAR